MQKGETGEKEEMAGKRAYAEGHAKAEEKKDFKVKLYGDGRRNIKIIILD